MMKNYKCSFIGLLLTVFIMLFVFACSNNDDPTPVPTPDKPVPVDPVEELTNSLLADYSPIFGKTISAETTPSVYEVIQKGRDACLDDDGEISNAEKAAVSWITALLLVEIKPQVQDELLAKGYSLGKVAQDFGNRIDGNAAFRFSSLTNAVMHHDEAFLALIEKARTE